MRGLYVAYIWRIRGVCGVCWHMRGLCWRMCGACVAFVAYVGVWLRMLAYALRMRAHEPYVWPMLAYVSMCIRQ